MSNVKNYTKIPLTIQAIPYVGPEDVENILEIIEFTDQRFRVRGDIGNSIITAEVYDHLHETWVGVKNGDFIIRGIQGEFYPHDGPLFPKAYNEVKPNG